MASDLMRGRGRGAQLTADHYRSLACRLQPLPRDGDEGRTLAAYLRRGQLAVEGGGGGRELIGIIAILEMFIRFLCCIKSFWTPPPPRTKSIIPIIPKMFSIIPAIPTHPGRKGISLIPIILDMFPARGGRDC